MRQLVVELAVLPARQLAMRLAGVTVPLSAVL
jgi:hypothetical protein